MKKTNSMIGRLLFQYSVTEKLKRERETEKNLDVFIIYILRVRAIYIYSQYKIAINRK